MNNQIDQEGHMTQKNLIRVHITGRVQGVFFRAKTKQEADRIGINGWVRNLPDGSVEALFEGDSEQLAQMVEWCRKGPSLARVDDVQVRPENGMRSFNSFDIVR